MWRFVVSVNHPLQSSYIRIPLLNGETVPAIAKNTSNYLRNLEDHLRLTAGTIITSERSLPFFMLSESTLNTALRQDDAVNR